MKKYIKAYISYIEKLIKEKDKFTDKEIANFKTKITYFQHERLIHLLVTLAYILFDLVFLGLGLLSYLFLIPFGMLTIFVIFYIRHYFFLENAVQYLYKLLDKINKEEIISD